MKKYILIAFCLFLAVPAAPGVTVKKWGYVYHGSIPSEQTRSYLEKRYDVIALTGYKINKSARITPPGSKARDFFKSLSSEKKIARYPCLSFNNAAEGSRILNSSLLQKRLCVNIASLLERYRFPGVHLDFEYLPPGDAPRLRSFLKRLKKRISPRTLTMAVFPQVDFPEKWSRFHDLKLIGPCLDGVVIMCYDYHRPGSGPGPVSDILWAEKNIRYALQYLKAHKLFLGIPAYGYQWGPGSKARAVSARYATALAKKHGYRRHGSGNMTISYKKNKINYTVYVSDKVMRNSLQRLAIQYNLAGTAMWRIGFEEKD